MKNNEFVFDTNALVSAILAPNSVSNQALRKADALGELAFSLETLEELRQVIVRSKFDRYLTIDERLEFVLRWEMKGNIYSIISNFIDCRDIKDNKFLNLAFDCGCPVIVTGDQDLLVLHPFRDIKIITPSQFLNQQP